MNDFIIKNGVLIKCKSNINIAIIPNEVKEIGDEAFIGITKLKSVQFNNNITKIGKRAFSNCYLLKEISFPPSLVIIQNGAFDDCVALDNYTKKAIQAINPLAMNMKFVKEKDKPLVDKLKWRTIADVQIEEYVYCIDASTYKLLYVNDSLLNQLGDTNYFNKTCYEHFFKQDKPCLLCKKDELKINESIAWYNKFKIEDNTYLIRSKLFDNNNSLAYIQSAHKINGHLDKFNFLEKMAVADKTVIECAKTLASSKDLDTVLDKLINLISSFVKSDCVLLYEMNPKTNTTNVTHKYQSEMSSFRYDENYNFNLEDTSGWSQKIMTKEFIYITNKDFQDHPEKYPFVTSNKFENVLILPLKVDNILVGFITANNMNDIDDRLKNFSTVRSISMFILYSLSLKYSNAKLEENYLKLKGEVDANKLMFKCSQTLLNSKDFDMGINELLLLLREFFDCSRIYIFKIDEETNNIFDWFEQLHQVESNITELFNLPSSDFLNIFNEFNKDNLVFINDLTLIDKNYTIYQGLVLDDAQQFAFTPIYLNDKIFGYISVVNPKSNVTELHILKTISLFISNHIEKSTLLSQLESLSYTDKLTDLYNRNFFNDYTNKMSEAKDLGIIFADVNSLKLANDRLGHEYGDLLIKCCAKVLSDSINGFCFRLGGDEFIIFCEHISDIDFEKNLEILDNMMLYCGDVHISIGSSWCSYTKNVKDEIKKADEDMYAKKEIYYQEKEKDTRTPERQLSDLRKSIDNLKVLFNL